MIGVKYSFRRPVRIGRIYGIVYERFSAWSEEIVAMWRFTRNNGITEGFHNRMELINRQGYSFRNYDN